MAENQIDHLNTLRQSYNELQDSASHVLSKALDESSRVYQSVLSERNDESQRRRPEKVQKEISRKPTSILDEFISEPSVPLRSKPEDEFVDLISSLMEPVRPKSPTFGNYVTRDN